MLENAVRIHMVGVELEGGWDNTFDDCVIGHDGSVQRPNNAAGAACAHWGELASPPLEPAKVEEWVRKHYPSGVNASCGMHIHLSMKRRLDYSRLMAHSFYRDFLSEMKKWAEEQAIPKEHPFWPRWEGLNQYCKREFTPDSQVRNKNKGGDRYSQLNFCFGLHGTFENRLAPGWENVNLALSYIHRYCDVVEAWLAKAPPEKAMILKIGVQETKQKIFGRKGVN